MIAAIDNLGGVYWGVLQANVDSEVMIVFLTHLVAKLRQEDSDWARNTVLLLDNATYHHHSGVLNQLMHQGVDVLYTGPYSFSGAPIELFFAALKRTMLNPKHLPTGKK